MLRKHKTDENERNKFPQLYILISTIIFLILTNKSFPQNTALLFKEFIPSEILNNKIQLNGLNINFEEDAKISPALIYYDIERLKNIFNDKKKIKNSLMNKLLYKKKRAYLQRRTDWANIQITKVNKHYGTFKRKNKIISYFRDLVNDTSNNNIGEEIPFIVNENMLSYVILKYKTKDTSLKFNPSQNYYDSLIIIENNFLKHLKTALRKNSVSLNSDILNSLKINWYIFDDYFNKNLNNQDFLDAYQIVHEIMQGFSYNNKFSIQIGYDLFQYNYTQKLPVKITGTKGNYIEPKDVEMQMSFLPKHISALFSYKIFLKNNPSLLSYLNLQLITAFSYKSSFITKSYYKESHPKANITETEKYNYENYISSNNIYTIKISTPCYIFNNTLSFELALNLSLMDLNSTLVYEYSYHKRSPFPIASGNGRGNFNSYTTSFLIYPTLEVNYETYDHLKLSLSSNHKYFAFFIGYSF